uniref:Putative Menaquinol oxidoreductase complex ACIII, menaquinol-binding membrane protein subunit ActC n=1 Tax=Candidatus Nitrotoga fabula TaxID=2182327 RepID=A0A2X0QXV1_9PROT|nr:putative Menaquinol oxidoreductase complex ACIII, menaquinol-binding membrane protein subunit ActC [Candidatus Nitrotoga fabula]
MGKDIREDIAWAQINKDVLKSLENPKKLYWVILLIAIAMVGVAVGCEIYQYQTGMGVSNKSNSHVWSLYIATFIFWIGMSHSGTLLSAILHLMHADWRKPIYRFAEAMTTFSLMTAGLFVLVHLGRLWMVYYVMPYPNERWVWPNFQSPLVWDMFAIATYLSSSVIFLYVGMIPDLAICRDNIHAGWRKKLYTVLSLGWEGTDRQWRNFRITYLTIACFLIPLAVSVHSIVASDFAMSNMPGWHVTSFPPYFVAGALYSGCAAIITLFVILRYVFKFEEYMTLPIMRKLVRLTFAIAMVWTYLNLIEFSSVWYGHDQTAKDQLIFKATGPYAPYFWAMIFFGSILPLLLAFKRFQTHLPLLFVVSILLNVGMWLERWMIIGPSFAHGHYPWTWDHDQWPSLVQWGIVFGSFGWFTLLFMVFCKVFPSVSMYEVKEMVYHRTLALKNKPAVKGEH